MGGGRWGGRRWSRGVGGGGSEVESGGWGWGWGLGVGVGVVFALTSCVVLFVCVLYSVFGVSRFGVIFLYSFYVCFWSFVHGVGVASVLLVFGVVRARMSCVGVGSMFIFTVFVVFYGFCFCNFEL